MPACEECWNLEYLICLVPRAPPRRGWPDPGICAPGIFCAAASGNIDAPRQRAQTLIKERIRVTFLTIAVDRCAGHIPILSIGKVDIGTLSLTDRRHYIGSYIK